MRFTFALIIAGIILSAAAALTLPASRDQPANAAMTTVILVRHAEKSSQPGNNDPDLTEQGRQRAQNLATVFANVDFAQAIATEYKRTQQTIDLICNAGTPRITMSARDSNAIARHILDECNGQNVFVAGHSNTVPAVMRALGVENAPRLTEEDYDNVFIVTIAPDGQARMLNLKINPARDVDAQP